MQRDLPSGTITFLFSDVEGSTRLLRELGAARYAGALAEHRRVIREACTRHEGVEVDTQGDAFFFALARYGASAEVETTDPRQAYTRFEPSRRERPSYWHRLNWA